MHFLTRYHGEELSWDQVLSSPEGHLGAVLDIRSMMATQQFVTDCQGERGEFKTEVGKLRLKDLWSLEKNLLRAIDNYPRLRRERNLGDGRMTEAAAVSCDLLGHSTLCLLSRFPRWMAYALQEHGR
jgi:hypothetical protein